MATQKRDRTYIYQVKKRWNASAIFLVKLVMGETLDRLGDNDINEGFKLVNTYLHDKQREDFTTDTLLLLFRPENWAEFETFLEKQEQHKNFIEEYDYDKGYVVLAYKIPLSLKKDFIKFKQGRYSEFSKASKQEFKRLIPSGIFGGRAVKSLQWEVFDREQDLKEQLEDDLDVQLPIDSEVWSVPSILRETLIIEDIYEQSNNKSTKQTESS